MIHSQTNSRSGMECRVCLQITFAPDTSIQVGRNVAGDVPREHLHGELVITGFVSAEYGGTVGMPIGCGRGRGTSLHVSIRQCGLAE